MDDWLRLLQAAAAEDRNACVDCSLKLGYLTGEENEVCASFAIVISPLTTNRIIPIRPC